MLYLTVLGKLVFSVAPKKTTTTTTNKRKRKHTNKQTESYIKSVIQITRYRAYSLTCSVSMQCMGTWGKRIHSGGEHLWKFLRTKEFLT